MRWTLVLEMNEMKVTRKICSKVNSIFWKILVPVSFCYDPLVLKKFLPDYRSPLLNPSVLLSLRCKAIVKLRTFSISSLKVK